jgi:hypothetical protein
MRSGLTAASGTKTTAMTGGFLVSEISELVCPEPGTGGRRVTLQCGSTLFSIADLKFFGRITQNRFQPPFFARFYTATNACGYVEESSF